MADGGARDAMRDAEVRILWEQNAALLARVGELEGILRITEGAYDLQVKARLAAEEALRRVRDIVAEAVKWAEYGGAVERILRGALVSATQNDTEEKPEG